MSLRSIATEIISPTCFIGLRKLISSSSRLDIDGFDRPRGQLETIGDVLSELVSTQAPVSTLPTLIIRGSCDSLC